MSKNSNSSSGGIGIFTTVGIVFVILKLCHVQPIAHWSWWWVLSPFWIGAAFGLVVLVIVLLVVLIAER